MNSNLKSTHCDYFSYLMEIQLQPQFKAYLLLRSTLNLFSRLLKNYIGNANQVFLLVLSDCSYENFSRCLLLTRVVLEAQYFKLVTFSFVSSNGKIKVDVSIITQTIRYQHCTFQESLYDMIWKIYFIVHHTSEVIFGNYLTSSTEQSACFLISYLFELLSSTDAQSQGQRHAKVDLIRLIFETKWCVLPLQPQPKVRYKFQVSYSLMRYQFTKLLFNYYVCSPLQYCHCNSLSNHS